MFPLLQATWPFLLPTPAASLALRIGALLSKRTLCLTALAGAVPMPDERQIPPLRARAAASAAAGIAFPGQGAGRPGRLQVAFLPTILGRLGTPRWIGLVIDGTSFETTLPHLRHYAGRRAHPVLTTGVPRCGRVPPLLSVADESGGCTSAGPMMPCG